MKLNKILFCITFFIFLNSCTHLFANENSDDKIAILAENICDGLASGHSVDEVIESVDKDIKKNQASNTLVKQIEEIFNKKNLKSNKKNKKFSKSYSLGKMLKDTLETITYLVVIVVLLFIGFLLYKYILPLLEWITSWFKKYILPLLEWIASWFKKKSRPADDGPLDNKLPPSQIPEPPKTQQTLETQKEQTQEPIQQAAQTLPMNEAPQKSSSEPTKPLEIQTEQALARPIPCTQKTPQQSQNAEKIPFREVPKINYELIEMIEQQLAYAEKLGLSTTEVQIDDVGRDKELIEMNFDKKFDELIEEQIEFAQSIGLVPIIPSDTGLKSVGN